MEKLSNKARRVICNLNDLNSDSIKVRDEAENLCQRAYNRAGETLDYMHNLSNMHNPATSDLINDMQKHQIEMERLQKINDELATQRKKNHTKSKPKRKPVKCSCKKK